MGGLLLGLLSAVTAVVLAVMALFLLVAGGPFVWIATLLASWWLARKITRWLNPREPGC